MRGRRRTQPRGVEKATEQLLLASELSLDADVAERLASLAHRLGELDADGDPDGESVQAVSRRLQDLRAETHTDVRDAIVRAQELLLPYCESAVSTPER